MATDPRVLVVGCESCQVNHYDTLELYTLSQARRNRRWSMAGTREKRDGVARKFHRCCVASLPRSNFADDEVGSIATGELVARARKLWTREYGDVGFITTFILMIVARIIATIIINWMFDKSGPEGKRRRRDGLLARNQAIDSLADRRNLIDKA